ncbi:MAG: FKBP-type peptidyl-prolyl cis-trans isomerase [Leptolyngbya sp. DLM2.Bin15]|nr:MAG: FKBP-type peptidyl-prolyl cis-trans isomerase [Leptolyngbya sp. DLM2.Bin15]
MREILISFGVIVACCLVLLVAQIRGTGDAIAAPSPTPEVTLADSSLSVPTEPELAQAPSTQASDLMNPAESPSEVAPVADNLITTESGLKYVELVEGTGAIPQTGQTVVVHYVGTLEDGTQFDSSRDRNRPFSFRLGTGQVIRGWDEGLSTMRVGGRRQLIIPPALGYGARGAGGVIPPNATLVFDVELLRIS